jgi:hypothetical protein
MSGYNTILSSLRIVFALKENDTKFLSWFLFWSCTQKFAYV